MGFKSGTLIWGCGHPWSNVSAPTPNTCPSSRSCPQPSSLGPPRVLDLKPYLLLKLIHTVTGAERHLVAALSFPLKVRILWRYQKQRMTGPVLVTVIKVYTHGGRAHRTGQLTREGTRKPPPNRPL